MLHIALFYFIYKSSPCYNVIFQLVENVARCMIKIAECVHQSSELLDGLCQHGLIQHAIRLINLNSRTTLSQTIYNVSKESYKGPVVLYFVCFYFSTRQRNVSL